MKILCTKQEFADMLEACEANRALGNCDADCLLQSCESENLCQQHLVDICEIVPESGE